MNHSRLKEVGAFLTDEMIDYFPRSQAPAWECILLCI